MKFEWRCIDCLKAVKLHKGKCAECGGVAVIQRAHWLTVHDILAIPRGKGRGRKFTGPRRFHIRKTCSN
jgi:hypothetical protein